MVQERTAAIKAWLSTHAEAIQSGAIKVYALDECHAKGSDICGYGWANRQERLAVEVDNYRDSQTYFGALDCLNGELLLQAATTANSASTIEFLKLVRASSGASKVVVIWDGASYHRSQALREYLSDVNQGDNWHLHCLRSAPYAPEENPIENIWGQAKQMLRQMRRRCQKFRQTKRLFEMFVNHRLFEMFVNHRLFTMPNLKSYDAFSGVL